LRLRIVAGVAGLACADLAVAIAGLRAHRANALVATVPRRALHCLSAGPGAEEHRRYDRAYISVELSRLSLADGPRHPARTASCRSIAAAPCSEGFMAVLAAQPERRKEVVTQALLTA
jgi:hypothetical protein